MADPNEIRALQSSFRGAVDAAEALKGLRGAIEALGPERDLTAEELDEVGRVTLAHAVASAALRGLVETMRQRRGAAP